MTNDEQLARRARFRDANRAAREPTKLRHYAQHGLAAFVRLPPRPKEPRQPTLSCIHRGAQLRLVDCETCGERGEQRPVFACALHGECVWRRYWRHAHGVKHERECIRCPDLSEIQP